MLALRAGAASPGKGISTLLSIEHSTDLSVERSFFFFFFFFFVCVVCAPVFVVVGLEVVVFGSPGCCVGDGDGGGEVGFGGGIGNDTSGVGSRYFERRPAPPDDPSPPSLRKKLDNGLTGFSGVRLETRGRQATPYAPFFMAIRTALAVGRYTANEQLKSSATDIVAAALSNCPQ